MTDTTVKCDIGFVGAGVMGKNLILNLADHGYRVAAFDLDHKKLESGDPARRAGNQWPWRQRGGLQLLHRIIGQVKPPAPDYSVSASR